MNKVGGTENLSNLLRNTLTETGRASYQSLLNSTALYLFGVNLTALHQDLLLFPLFLSHAKIIFYWLIRVIYQPLHQFRSVVQSCPTLCAYIYTHVYLLLIISCCLMLLQRLRSHIISCPQVGTPEKLAVQRSKDQAADGIDSNPGLML